MPVYSYKGYDAKGRVVSGVKDADNQKTLRAALRRDGILLTEAREGGARARATTQTGGQTFVELVNPAGALRAFRERESADRAQVATITRQLGTLLKAGVPLAESLGALVEQLERP